MTPPGELPSMHNETEHDGWTINIGDHPARKDSALYRRSREMMIKALMLCGPDGYYYGCGLVTLKDTPKEDPSAGGVP